MRFLGVDLAWKDGNGSGVVALAGERFPLRLHEAPRVLSTHDEVLGWIGARVGRHRTAVGIDAPLLGLEGGGRRDCDNEISRVFGRFHASTHSPSQVPALDRFTRSLLRSYGIGAFGPDARAAAGRPAIREVYPNALQVRLFDLDTEPRQHIVKYKRRRFPSHRRWVEQGLAPFIRRCRDVVAGTYVARDPVWTEFVADRPRPTHGGRALKAIEDRWDALLCALAVAIELIGPRGAMRFYPAAPGAWRAGYILAPELSTLSP